MHVDPVWLVLQLVLLHTPPHLQQTKPICPLLDSYPKSQLPVCPLLLILQHTPGLLPDPLVWVASTLVQVSIWWSEITPVVVIVFIGDAHDVSPKYPKDSSLLWFCVYVCPHLLCWTMLDGYLLPINFVFNERILYLNMLSPLRAACSSIGLEQDSSHVVLIEQGWIHIISLLYQKVASPEDIPQCIIHSN